MIDTSSVEIFFMDSHSSSLFCSLYVPPQRPNSTIDTGIIFFNPIFEAAELIHVFYANTARYFSQKHSLLALRFDYFGQGDSHGDFKDATLKLWIDNGLDTIRFLQKKGVKFFFFIGFDFGANIASYVASQVKDEKIRLILVNPVLDIKKRLKQYLRSNITNQITKYGKVCFSSNDLLQSLHDGGNILIEGYPVGNELYNGLASLEYDDIKFSRSTVAVDFIFLDNKNPAKDYPSAERYCDLFREQGISVAFHKE